MMKSYQKLLLNSLGIDVMSHEVMSHNKNNKAVLLEFNILINVLVGSRICSLSWTILSSFS